MIKKILILVLLTFQIVFAQKNNSEMQIVFNHKVGNETLVLNDKLYLNANNEGFKISKFDYYISNVFLKKSNGEFVVFENQYFLVKSSDSTSQQIVLKNIPTGKYKSISFLVGVDSLKNTTDIGERTGVLDPMIHPYMYWAWNSGYKFLAFEGYSEVIVDDKNPQKLFKYHIGGFGGKTSKTVNNLRRIEIVFDNKKFKAKSKNTIFVNVDVNKIFDKNISLKTISTIMMPAKGTIVADNFKMMFGLDKIITSK